MAAIKGFRLIRQTSNGVFYFNCSNGQVEYSPRRKYRLEKKNAYDPTILHLRDEYREDSFDLQATLNPDEYYTLMSFITAAGNLYLEYNAYNEVKSQVPVTVSQYRFMLFNLFFIRAPIASSPSLTLCTSNECLTVESRIIDSDKQSKHHKLRLRCFGGESL